MIKRWINSVAAADFFSHHLVVLDSLSCDGVTQRLIYHKFMEGNKRETAPPRGRLWPWKVLEFEWSGFDLRAFIKSTNRKKMKSIKWWHKLSKHSEIMHLSQNKQCLHTLHFDIRFNAAGHRISQKCSYFLHLSTSKTSFFLVSLYDQQLSFVLTSQAKPWRLSNQITHKQDLTPDSWTERTQWVISFQNKSMLWQEFPPPTWRDHWGGKVTAFHPC